MTGYGTPPTTPPPLAPRRSASPELPQLLGYAAGLLGILSFVWGFLSWFSRGVVGTAGYSVLGSGAGAAIGLSIAAGAIAAADAFEKKPAGVIPAALSLAAFLVSLGLLIAKSPTGVSVGVGVGLILELITTFLQTVVLAYLWLLATGRAPAPQPRPARGGRPAQHSAQPQDPYHAGPSMAGPGAPPPGRFPPQPPPGGYAPPAQPQYGPPPSYGQQYPPPPPEPPARGYGPPPATSSPSGPGAEPGFAPPARPPQPEERPGAQWSPQTSYPGSRPEPERPDSEEGSANP